MFILLRYSLWFWLFALQAACTRNAAPPAGSCQIHAEQAALQDVVVQAAPKRIPLQLDAAQVSVTMLPGSAPAVLEVHSPLRFQTSYPTQRLNLRLRRNVELYDDRLTLGAGIKPTWRGARGDRALISLEPSLQLQIDRAPSIPCAALTLAGRDARYATPMRVRPEAARVVGLGSHWVSWYSSPLSEQPIAVRYAGPFELLDRRRGRARLRAQWRDGSRLEGWVAKERLQSAGPWPHRSVEGAEFPGGCAATDLNLQRAQVAADAPLAAAPDGPVWAHFASQQRVTVYSPRAEDEWVAVAAILGVTLEPCADSLKAWVRARDVRLLAPPAHRD